ncbi:uncharacterized protein LOC118536288 [Halichoerus grypus]
MNPSRSHPVPKGSWCAEDLPCRKADVLTVAKKVLENVFPTWGIPSIISSDQAYHQQIKEALLNPISRDPVGHSLEPGNRVFWKCHQRRTASLCLMGRELPKCSRTQSTAKLEHIEPWVHVSLIKNAPPDIRP